MRIKFFQKIIDKIRNKKNKIPKHVTEFLKDNDFICEDKVSYKKIDIRILGKNNIIKIGKGVNISAKLSLQGYCDNSYIEIGNNFQCRHLTIKLGQNHEHYGKIENVKVIIGDNTSYGSGKIMAYNSNTCIKIGHDCMISTDVLIYNTDSHPIYDLETGEIINKVRDINIGNHVWLGWKSTVLKNVSIANDCIVGYHSVVTGSFDEEHSVLAGIPAKIVRKNVTWDCDGSKGYVQNPLDTDGDDRLKK